MWRPSAITEGDNFALRMMKKQGWSQGEGLGKNGGGIAEPLRPSLKFDSSGVGHDAAKEFTSNWWEQAYKKAADKIQITNGEQETEIKTLKKLDKKTVEKQKREAKNKLYSQFVQSATLTNGILEDSSKPSSANASSDSSDSDDDEDKFKRLTDEELFKACGGLTAHKGARHGHKMSAKMKRIEEQEKELLNQMKQSYGVSEKPQESKKRKRSKEEVGGETAVSEESAKKKKKKSKKEKKSDDERPENGAEVQDSVTDKSEVVGEAEPTKKKKKKSKKEGKDEAPVEAKDEPVQSDAALPADAESSGKKKKKNAKKNKAESSDKSDGDKEQSVPEANGESLEEPTKKKKKKKKSEKD